MPPARRASAGTDVGGVWTGRLRSGLVHGLELVDLWGGLGNGLTADGFKRDAVDRVHRSLAWDDDLVGAAADGGGVEVFAREN